MMTDVRNPGDVFSTGRRSGLAGIPFPAPDAATFRCGSRSVALLAEHEARHVVTAAACGLAVKSATIIPASGYAGCVFLARDDYRCKPLQEFSDTPLLELLGGVRPVIDGHRLSRETCVFVFARTIMALAGSGEKDLQQATALARVVSSKPAAFLHFARADCRRILDVNRHQVELITAALLEFKTLNAEEIAAVLSGRPDVMRRKQWADVAAGAAAFKAAYGSLQALQV